MQGRIGNMMSIVSAIYTLAKDNGDEATFPSFESNLRHLDGRDFNLPYALKAQENYPKIFSKIKTNPWNFEKRVDTPTGYGKIEYSPNTLYNGYMQSPLYFKHRIDEIRDLFSCPRDIAKYISDKYDLNQLLCSIHVRRSDYLFYPNIHPTLSMSYYKMAMDIIEMDVKPKYWVFSDDIEYCKANFPGCEIIDEPDYVSIYMMACCDHNIVANSSFSIWGALLSKVNNKIVIAPGEERYVGKDLPIINDIIPKEWIQLDEF